MALLGFQRSKSSIIAANDDLAAGHNLFYSKLTSLTLFRQDKLGPMPFGDLELPCGPDRREVDLLKLGAFYTMAVGQGLHYNTGLYGPLPVLDTNFRCLIFATKVADKKQYDYRMKGKNYVITCFFYHKELEAAVQHNRTSLDRAIRRFFECYGNVDELEENWKLLKITVQNYIYCTNTCMEKGILEP
ncbi:MAG: hypothetical protein ACFFD4_26690 [Candidatus Odinarchaeota archaeon]